MSLSIICQNATCFPADWRLPFRLSAMIRKLAFLELNQHLKNTGTINRYKRNVALSEIFDSGYSKTVSSMIRDLILSIFTNINLNMIQLDKQRGYPAYCFRMLMPRDQIVFNTLLIDLERLRDTGFLSWTTWRLTVGREGSFVINFANLPIMARDPRTIQSNLQAFIAFLNDLAQIVRGLHPAPQAVVQLTQPVVEEPDTAITVALPQAVEAEAIDATLPPRRIPLVRIN